MHTAATFTINDHRYDLADTETLTFREQRLVQRLSGIAAVDLDDELAAMNADAWYGLLLVSMRRQRPDVSEAELDDRGFVEVMLPIAEQLQADKAGDDAGPPLAAGEANETTPAETTRADNGAP